MNEKIPKPTPEEQAAAAVQEQVQLGIVITGVQPHPSVVGMRTNPLNYLVAAEQETCPVARARLLGVAEGLAVAAVEIAGLQGIREYAVLRKVLLAVREYIPEAVAQLRR